MIVQSKTGPVTRSWSFRGDRRGVAALEFALIAPVFFVLIIGALNVALMLFSQMSLDYTLFNVARKVELGTYTNSAQVKNAICQNATLLFGSCASNLQVYAVSAQYRAQFAGMTPPTTNADGTLSSTGFDVGTDSSYVMIKVAYRMPYISSILQPVTGQTGFALNSIEMFQNEPFGKPTGP